MVPTHSDMSHAEELALVMQHASDVSREQSLWNANVSPISPKKDSPLKEDGSAIYQSFQSENVTDTIDYEEENIGGPGTRLINHQVLDNQLSKKLLNNRQLHNQYST